MSADIVRFRRKSRRRPAPCITLGDLVDEADAISLGQVTAKMAEHYAAILPSLGGEGDQGPEFMRHMILASRLSERLIFEVYEVPKQRAHRIGGVRP